MSETQFQERACQLLELHGWFPLESDKASMGKTRHKGAFMEGFPDLLCLKGETFLLIELKTPVGKLSEKQKTLRDRFAALGIQITKCHTEDDLLALLRGRTRRLNALHGGK